MLIGQLVWEKTGLIRGLKHLAAILCQAKIALKKSDCFSVIIGHIITLFLTKK